MGQAQCRVEVGLESHALPLPFPPPRPGKEGAQKGTASQPSIPLPKIVATESGNLGVVEPSQALAKQLEVQFEDDRKEQEEEEERRQHLDKLEAEAEAGAQGDGAEKDTFEKKDD